MRKKTFLMNLLWCTYLTMHNFCMEQGFANDISYVSLRSTYYLLLIM